MNTLNIAFACQILLLISQSVSINFDFHQTRYKVLLESGKVVNYSSDYYEHFEMFTFNTRKEGILLNSTVTLKIDLEQQKLRLQLFQFLSNEYRRTSINFFVNACQGLKYGFFGVDVWKTTNGNFTVCPLKKGTYNIWNYKPNSEKFPPYLPEGRYRLFMQQIEENTERIVYTNIVHARIENIVRSKN